LMLFFSGGGGKLGALPLPAAAALLLLFRFESPGRAYPEGAAAEWSGRLLCVGGRGGGEKGRRGELSVERVSRMARRRVATPPAAKTKK
jgi:hypothetical protein